MPPLVPVMVNEVVPLAAAGLAESVNWEVAPAVVAVTGFLENDPVTLDGKPETLRVTGLPLPIAVTVTVKELLDLRVTEMVDGAVIENPDAAVTVKETVVVCTPLLPDIVSVLVAIGVEAVVVMVSVEFPEPLAGGVRNVGFNVHVAFIGQPVTVKFTWLANPEIELTLTVGVPDWPCATLTDDGLAESEKSGGGAVTVKENEVVCTPLPDIVIRTGPADVVELVVMLSWEVIVPPAGGVTGDGLKEQLIPPVQSLVNVTELLNPAIEVTVMVELVPPPCTTLADEGLAESEKSGVMVPQPVNLNDPMRVCPVERAIRRQVLIDVPERAVVRRVDTQGAVIAPAMQPVGLRTDAFNHAGLGFQRAQCIPRNAAAVTYRRVDD